MRGEGIAMFCWSDRAGFACRRSFLARGLEEQLVKGIGWLPVSQVLAPSYKLAASVRVDLVRSWFASNLFDAYLSWKRTARHILEGLLPMEMRERCRNVY